MDCTTHLPSQGRHPAFRKSMTLLACFALIFTIMIGGTVAYLVASTQEIANQFAPTQVTCAIEETFEGGVKSNVSLQNTGGTDAYLRAFIVANWQDDNGNILAAAPVRGAHYTLELNAAAGGWFLGNDGYYYYSSPVAPGQKTDVLITSCFENTPKEGYTLCVEILGSAIQSSPSAAVTEAWKVTVDSSGLISQ